MVIYFTKRRKERRINTLVKVGVANSHKTINRECKSIPGYKKFMYKDVKFNEEGD